VRSTSQSYTTAIPLANPGDRGFREKSPTTDKSNITIPDRLAMHIFCGDGSSRSFPNSRRLGRLVRESEIPHGPGSGK
jgi:hypothetical protein